MNISINKRNRFAEEIKSVYIEISDSCNRKCVFCPNHDQARLATSPRKRFDLSIYSRLCEELGSIGYKGNFGYHLYNEPLLDYEHFLKCLRISYQALPMAKLTLNTNGDFLSAARLKEIIGAGMSTIHVSLYAPRDGAGVTKEIARAAITRMATKLELDIESTSIRVRDATKYYTNHVHAGATVRLVMEDFNQVGIGYSSRLQDSNEALASYHRKASCQSPVDQILIDINGNYLPCCNIHTSDSRYEDYIITNIRDTESVVAAYFSREFDFWRKGCSCSPPLFAICRSCSRADNLARPEQPN